jgi:transcriptional regulator with XRE-family HTH domain
MIENSELRQTIGANVKRRRNAIGVNQAELAKRVGVTLVHISRIETGISSPSAEVLFAISDALGCKADELRQVALVSVK